MMTSNDGKTQVCKRCKKEKPLWAFDAAPNAYAPKYAPPKHRRHTCTRCRNASKRKLAKVLEAARKQGMMQLELFSEVA